MAKLKQDPIGQTELLRYVEENSDFDFELQCLHELGRLQFKCEHSGTYTDPVTSKPREFDIRAKFYDSRERRILLAVECKNIRENFPLLVSTVPRQCNESYNCALLVLDRGVFDQARYSVIQASGSESRYHVGSPVGKSCVQVGIAENSQLSWTDAELYPKWSQAISSASEMIEEEAAIWAPDGCSRTAVILPLVVVPEGRLWVVTYDETGNRLQDPQVVDNVPYYVGHSVCSKSAAINNEFRFSHIEFVTLRGLERLKNQLTEVYYNEHLYCIRSGELEAKRLRDEPEY